VSIFEKPVKSGFYQSEAESGAPERLIKLGNLRRKNQSAPRSAVNFRLRLVRRLGGSAF
jgi:hypothetical protein